MEFSSQEELLQALGGPDAARREEAAYEIGRLGDPAFLPHLVLALKDDSPRVRWRALQSLGKIGGAGMGEEVLPCLEDESPTVRAEAARLIGTLRDPEYLHPLSRLLADENLQVRCNTIEAVGEIGSAGEDLLETITRLLEHEESGIRIQATVTLGKCRFQPAFSSLLKNLQDPHQAVRGLSAWALGRLGNQEAVEALITALGDSGESVRIYAYQALLAFGNRALPALERAAASAARSSSFTPYVERLLDEIAESGEDHEGRDALGE